MGRVYYQRKNLKSKGNSSRVQPSTDGVDFQENLGGGISGIV